MTIQGQIRTVLRLISDDERNIAAVLEQITGAYSTAVDPHGFECVDQWAEELLCLRRGLEGLKLKHDSLVDRTDLRIPCPPTRFSPGPPAKTSAMESH